MGDFSADMCGIKLKLKGAVSFKVFTHKESASFDINVDVSAGDLKLGDKLKELIKFAIENAFKLFYKRKSTKSKCEGYAQIVAKGAQKLKIAEHKHVLAAYPPVQEDAQHGCKLAGEPGIHREQCKAQCRQHYNLQCCECTGKCYRNAFASQEEQSNLELGDVLAYGGRRATRHKPHSHRPHSHHRHTAAPTASPTIMGGVKACKCHFCIKACESFAPKKYVKTFDRKRPKCRRLGRTVKVANLQQVMDRCD